ncbi:MAG: hypothetical protein K0S60_706 [Evtepia sp.]|jgi:hypothetical protein|nr:hypothetical protein [Evtepia sp.]
MATTYYYAYINSSKIVEQIYDMPAPIDSPNYISITSHDVSLIGKRYNTETHQFEVVTWFCYAMLNEKDIVTQVIRRETALPEVPNNMIVIQTYDETLVGKWYNRTTGTFSAPPIHVLADHSTDKINVGTQDVWLTDKLGAMDGKFGSIDGKLGLIDGLLTHSLKCKVSETRNNTIFDVGQKKMHFSFPFENKVAGYLPKYVFLQVGWEGDDFEREEAAHILLVRNGEDTELYSLCRKGNIVYNANGSGEFQGHLGFLYYPKANTEESCFDMSMYQNNVSVCGGDAFMSYTNGCTRYDTAYIGYFKYDTNGVEFDINTIYQDAARPTTRFKIRAFAY